MPRIRDETHPMTRLLRGYGLNGNVLSQAIRSSPATARKKINNPMYLTVGDLLTISRKWGIPMEDIRRCVSAN